MYKSPPRHTLFPYTTLFRSLFFPLPGRMNEDDENQDQRKKSAEKKNLPITLRGIFFARAGLFHSVPNKRESKPPRRNPFSSRDRKSTRLNSSHTVISYAVFC